jgi:hypothetical protein
MVAGRIELKATNEFSDVIVLGLKCNSVADLTKIFKELVADAC